MRILTTCGLALALSLHAGSASAGATIVTAALEPTAAGKLTCRVVNASETKALGVDIEIRNNVGAIVDSTSATIEPGVVHNLDSLVDTARYCFVRVTKGSRKQAIVSLVSIDGGVPVSTVVAN